MVFRMRIKWFYWFAGLFLSVILGAVQSLNAQGIAEQSPAFIYCGAGFGFNDYGVGVSIEKPLSHQFSLYGNAGYGGWGMRYGSGLTYYLKPIDEQTGVSVGYSYATGIDDHHLKLSTMESRVDHNVDVDLKSLSTVNLVLSRNYRMGHKSKLALSIGYAFLLSNDNYSLKDPEVKLDDDAQQKIKVMEPGGFIFGLRFMFGA